uniref:Uncharacterized protein n=1 Tax=Ciona savignyi TaxID=51511 RepID=H2YF67_CIOSA
MIGDGAHLKEGAEGHVIGVVHGNVIDLDPGKKDPDLEGEMPNPPMRKTTGKQHQSLVMSTRCRKISNKRSWRMKCVEEGIELRSGDPIKDHLHNLMWTRINQGRFGRLKMS